MECKVPDDCKECHIQKRTPKINWHSIINELKLRIKDLWYSTCEFFGIEGDVERNSLPGILLTDSKFGLPEYDGTTDTIILPLVMGNCMKILRMRTSYTCHELTNLYAHYSLAHELGERAISMLGIVTENKEMRERVDYVCEAFCEYVGLLFKHPIVGYPGEIEVKELCKKIKSVPPHQRKDIIKNYIKGVL